MSAIDVFGYGIDLLAVLLLALGLKGLSKVRSARSANGLAALAMGLAVAGLLIQLQPSPTAWLWIAVGTAGGGLLGLLTAQRVPMTAMPETVALFNGCGGMASLLVALAHHRDASLWALGNQNSNQCDQLHLPDPICVLLVQAFPDHFHTVATSGSLHLVQTSTWCRSCDCHVLAQ